MCPSRDGDRDSSGRLKVTKKLSVSRFPYFWSAGDPRRPPEIAQHRRSRCKTLRSELLVLSSLRLGAELLDLVQFVQAIEVGQSRLQIAPDSLTHRRDDASGLRDERSDVGASHVAAHVLTFEPVVKAFRGR